MKNLKNLEMPNIYNSTVGIIGLGYVGLPLAVEIALNKKCKFTGLNIKRKVIGYDINKSRILELQENFDITNEVSNVRLQKAKNILFTSELDDLYDSDYFIVTVPTPIDLNNKPDLTLIKKASMDL